MSTQSTQIKKGMKIHLLGEDWGYKGIVTILTNPIERLGIPYRGPSFRIPGRIGTCFLFAQSTYPGSEWEKVAEVKSNALSLFPGLIPKAKTQETVTKVSDLRVGDKVRLTAQNSVGRVNLIEGRAASIHIRDEVHFIHDASHVSNIRSTSCFAVWEFVSRKK